MSQYTRFNRAEIVEILAQYGISGLRTFKILSGGSENTNYLVETKEGQYVLSICEQKTVEQATALARLLEYLATADFQSSKVISSLKAEVIIIRADKPIMLKAFINGNIRQDLSPSLLAQIGKKLAQLHKIPAPEYLPKTIGYGINHFHQVNTYAANSEFAHWLKTIEEYLTPFLSLKLPKAFIHSDLFWSNIIISSDETDIFIMDFEEAAYYYRAFDIGMTIIGLCAEDQVINLKKAQHFLKGYQSETSLQEAELNALKAYTVYAGAAMTFWRHQNFNYTKPDPAMFDHYLGLKVLVDFLMAQEEDCLLKYVNSNS